MLLSSPAEFTPGTHDFKMNLIQSYTEHLTDRFGLRHYPAFNLMIFRVKKQFKPADFVQVNEVLQSNPTYNTANLRFVDLRDHSFLSAGSNLNGMIEIMTNHFDDGRQRAVLCNTPAESAMIYLLLNRSKNRNISLQLFCSTEAALEYLKLPFHTNSFTQILQSMEKEMGHYRASQLVG